MWPKIKSWAVSVGTAPLIFLGIVALCLITIALIATGQIGKFNVGGWFGKLLRQESPSIKATKAPPSRVQELEEPDSKGIKQIEVLPFEVPSAPWRDKTKIKTPSGKTIALPDGVWDTNVEEGDSGVATILSSVGGD